MREANQVLSIIQERGKRGLPLEDLYRQLYNPTLYLKAHGKIYRNDGAMTKGVTTEAVDAMSRLYLVAIMHAGRGADVAVEEEKIKGVFSCLHSI